MNFGLIVCLVFVSFRTLNSFQAAGGRLKSEEFPRLVNWRVLEGITEPFDVKPAHEEPLWKQMKSSADNKAANLLIQQALHEYGQLLRHPYMFGEMPMEERYDVFLSMAKLLKVMGFYQKAEMLLYEAISYSMQPYEAHFQLSLLFLDKEDVDMAKVHLKNCLYFRETDTLILIHLAVVLMTEGRIHESKFFISRILAGLHNRILKLSKAVDLRHQEPVTSNSEHGPFYHWLEDLIARVFHGDMRITTTTTIEMYQMFSTLYDWLGSGEISGRFVFDLGQVLYEGGWPKIGQMMMRRGFETSNSSLEGVVSPEVVRIRLAMDYPVIPGSANDIVLAYLNMTSYLSESQTTYTRIDLENVIDVYWPLPLLGWSGLPMWPVVREFLWRFGDGPVRKDTMSQYWLRNPNLATSRMAALKRLDELSERNDSSAGLHREEVSVGVFGGHMNSHPVGQMVLLRVLDIAHSLNANREKQFSLTLLALSLLPDHTTKLIAGKVSKIVNLPVNTDAAWKVIEEQALDIVIFPDWQPFPDMQSALFQSLRIAPVQICLFVRGTSCGSIAIDYYIRPMEVIGSYLQDTPAAELGGSSRSSTLSQPLHRPAWKERFAEQTVLLEWPLLTPNVIRTVLKNIMTAETVSQNAGKSAETPGNIETSGDRHLLEESVEDKRKSKEFDESLLSNPLSFLPSDHEGRIFFENQPVAAIIAHPTFVHPLMDDAVLKLMHAVPNLQVVVVLSEHFFSHTLDVRQRTIWARKLVRRLWDRGGDLHHRIRLLPFPMSDFRLLQFLQKADIVLDTFPMGMSFHTVAMALSVGTPVVTMANGVVFETPRKDLEEIRSLAHQSRRHTGNPIFRQIVKGDVPWGSSASSVAELYNIYGFGPSLVANSTDAYVSLASRLAIDRESGYDLRVKLLELIDEKAAVGLRTARLRDDPYEVRDLARFLHNVGRPWSAIRSAVNGNQRNSTRKLKRIQRTLMPDSIDPTLDSPIDVDKELGKVHNTTL